MRMYSGPQRIRFMRALAKLGDENYSSPTAGGCSFCKQFVDANEDAGKVIAIHIDCLVEMRHDLHQGVIRQGYRR